MGGHSEEVDPSGVHFHDKQDIESAQRDGVEGEEVGGQQSGGLSAQEGPPSGVGPGVVLGRVERRSGSGGSCLHPGSVQAR